jgi:hypothetical protein
MKTRNVVGWMALTLVLNACRDKTENLADAAATRAPRADAKGTAGALVNPRDLARFIPDKLAEFVQVEEVEASLASVEGNQIAKALCKYEADGKTLFITITDAIGAGSLRAPFANAAGLNNEDALGGYQKGKRIDAYPATAVWDARTRRSEVMTLVADRYVVKVDVRKAAADDEAEKLAGLLDIRGLAKLKPSAE